jgi:CRP-like cAMP-binding protein
MGAQYLLRFWGCFESLDVSVSRGEGNRLLSALSPAALERLGAGYQTVYAGETLFEIDQVPQDAFFPDAPALISLIRGTNDGVRVEVGVVGGEGFACVQSMLAGDSPGIQAIVQISGRLRRVSADRLREGFDRDAGVRSLMLQYAALFIDQLTQAVVCNRLHTIEQRLSKWLLTVREGAGADDFQMSHDFLAQMLGIQRTGVTLAMGALRDGGMITHSRKQIHIRDPRALKCRACECFGFMQDKLNQYRSQLRRA